MIAMETDRLVDDYLRRLDAAAAHLQRSRRAELVAEIREHIETALREEQAADEVAVRNVLERLGPPEEIVEAAEPPAHESAARTGKLEIAALVAMVIPFIGWLFGIVLVLVSQAWTSREKLVGVALALTPVLVPLLGFVAAGADGTQGPVPGRALGRARGGEQRRRDRPPRDGHTRPPLLRRRPAQRAVPRVAATPPPEDVRDLIARLGEHSCTLGQPTLRVP